MYNITSNLNSIYYQDTISEFDCILPVLIFLVIILIIAIVISTIDLYKNCQEKIRKMSSERKGDQQSIRPNSVISL